MLCPITSDTTRVETRRGLVEDQQARVGEDRARDADALPLAARELHAAFADDRVESLGEAIRELVDARDPTGLADLRLGRVGTRERDVLADRAREQEAVLQHDAELRAIAVEAHGREVDVVHAHHARRRRVERGDEPDDRALARTARTHERGDRADGCLERHVLEHRLVRLVREIHVIERDRTVDAPERLRAARVVVLGAIREHLLRALEPGDGLGQLCADGDDLEDRRDQEAEEHRVGEVPAERERAVEDVTRARVHDDRADDAEQ